MKNNFIKTMDSNTANTLKKLGFQRLSESDGVYIYLNSDKIQFSSDIDKSKIQYSNILTF